MPLHVYMAACQRGVMSLGISVCVHIVSALTGTYNLSNQISSTRGRGLQKVRFHESIVTGRKKNADHRPTQPNGRLKTRCDGGGGRSRQSHIPSTTYYHSFIIARGKPPTVLSNLDANHDTTHRLLGVSR